MRLIIVLTLLGTALAVPKSISRIVGGSPTTVEHYPYISNMQFGMFGIYWFHACGGSLLTTTSILSAAHCYHNDSPHEWRVRLGTSLASSGGVVHAVSHFVLHPQFSIVGVKNNVAIVRLSTPAVYSNLIQPVSIAGVNYNIADNTSVVTLGWGITDPSDQGSFPEQLQHVNINVINQQICAERYAHLKTQPGYENWPDVTDGMLCAGILDVGGKDSCVTDDGGPLVHSRVVVGIVSWGYRCADPTYPGVNTLVSQYTDWIVNNA